MNDTVCIIVPHGDDESLGFGGAIQRHVADNDQVYVIFGRAPHNKRTSNQADKIKKAQKILGYKKYFLLDISITDISSNFFVYYNKLESILLEINPNIVYTTFWGDIHQDHKATFEVVNRLIRVWGNFRVEKFLVGEIPSSTDQQPQSYISFNPNYYIPLSEELLNNKIKSLKEYDGEIREYPHPRSELGLVTKSRVRGQECGHEYAEAFLCVRNIQK